jgi:hypothetical protein
MNPNNCSTLTIDLDRTAHATAAKFALGQTSIAKGRKVYLNTLAVCAVRQYLHIVYEMDLDLTQGDSWQIELQSIMNVADLVIPDVGKIECVVVLPNMTEIQLPAAIIDDAATAQADRIGYVFVQFSEDLHSVELLGFSQPVNTEYISIDCLQSLDNLLDLIDTASINHLQAFLVGILGNGWQPIEFSIASPHREFALRNSISLPKNTSYESIRDFTASKMINLRANIANIPLLLLIGLSEEPDGRIKVRIRLHAAGGVPLLPAHLKLALHGANEQILSEIQYPEPMNFIQLQSFKLPVGTQFKIRVELEGRSFTESFVA